MCVTNAACPLGGTRSLQVFAYYGSLNALREAADHKQNDCCMPHGRHPICGSLNALREAADQKWTIAECPLGGTQSCFKYAPHWKQTQIRCGFSCQTRQNGYHLYRACVPTSFFFTSVIIATRARVAQAAFRHACPTTFVIKAISRRKMKPYRHHASSHLLHATVIIMTNVKLQGGRAGPHASNVMRRRYSYRFVINASATVAVVYRHLSI